MSIFSHAQSKKKTQKKSETELTAIVLKKDPKHKRLKVRFFNWTKQDNNFVQYFIWLKSVLLISCVLDPHTKQ